MRERADRIGARLHVMSSATAGTEVELSVPGHVAFQNYSDISWFRKHFLPPAKDKEERRL